MPTAVIRVHFDPHGHMPDVDYQRGLDLLTEDGVDFIVTARGRNATGSREVEVLTDFENGSTAAEINTRCSKAFGVDTALGVVTYVSRGTDDDATGVLERFGIKGQVYREIDDHNDEIVTVTVPRESERRVPESRLHTALEAALNCEVRILMT